MRKAALQMGVIVLVASVPLTAVALLIDWFPEPASTAADDVDLLYDVLLIISVPIFVLVMTVVIYTVVRFRARPGDEGDGQPIHGNVRLEIVWVAIPTVLVFHGGKEVDRLVGVNTEAKFKAALAKLGLAK